MSFLTKNFLILSTLFSLSAYGVFSGDASVASKMDKNATLRWMISSYPNTLNPINYRTGDESDIISPVYETLMATDPDTGDLACWLCENYSYSKDKTSITFNLRKDISFHDGKPMTSKDVAFSFEAAMHPQVDNFHRKPDLLNTIKKVETVDAHTIRFHLKIVKFSNIYTVAGLPIVPKHVFPQFKEKPKSFNKSRLNASPLGTGPYQFSKWNRASNLIELKRSTKWWGDKDPRFKHIYNFKTIQFRVVTNNNAAFQAFKKGEFDFSPLSSFQYQPLLKEYKSNPSKMKVVPKHLNPRVGTSFMFIAWNGRLQQLSDSKTRKALSLLTNRQETLQKFSKGLRPPTNGPWGINSIYQCPVSECPVLPFSPSKARKLLKEAGWTDSNKDGILDRKNKKGELYNLSFSILASEGDYAKNVLGVYVNEMKKAGVDAKVKQIDWSTLIKLVDEESFDAYFSGFSVSYPILPRGLWHSDSAVKGGYNSWYFKDKEADKLIDTYEKEFSKEKRIELSRKLHKIIYKKNPVTFHHEGGGCYLGFSKELKGVTLAPYYSDCFNWAVWYKEKKVKK